MNLLQAFELGMAAGAAVICFVFAAIAALPKKKKEQAKPTPTPKD